MKPSQLARRRSSHLIIFGDPKTGKSTLVSKLLLKGYRLTWISMDNGHEVIFKLPLTQEQLDEQLNIIIVPDTKESPVALGTCRKILSGSEARICDTHGQADCSTCRSRGNPFSVVDTSKFTPRDILVLDHVGQLANSCMNYILRAQKEETKPEWEHYRIQGTLMDMMLTNIQQAAYNVICITHTTETEMEDGKKKLVPLVGTTPFSRNVGKYFDHVVYCDLSSATHKFASSTTFRPSIITGSRTDVAIEKQEVADLSTFFDGTIQPDAEYAEAAAAKVLAPPLFIVSKSDTTESNTTKPEGPQTVDTNTMSLLEKLKKGLK